ncbi:MAG: prolyl-tRNA synthetase associated domain-containing protein [Bdellovibrionales bacterium]|nr:prolyl-tRNA synthetase associated domain-containing protein [Bdellovibrionales bacterium]
MMTEQELLETLAGYPFERHEHPAVFTSEAADKFTSHLRGVPTKNLFLRDKKKKNYLLLVVRGDKRVDLAQFSRDRGLSRVSLGSPEDLFEKLGVTPGSVTILSVINDQNGQVRLFVDSDLSQEDFWHCHPLVNTATLIMKGEHLLEFVETCSHPAQMVNVPVVSENSREG